MIDPVIILFCAAAGFTAGFLAGLMGIGGGVVFIPVLHFLLPLLDVNADDITHASIATSLLAGIFAAGSSSIHHVRSGNVNLKYGLLIAAGSILTASVMPRFVLLIPFETLRIILLTVLIAVALKMFFENNNERQPVFKLHRNYLFVTGIVVGVFSSLTGLGGGIIIVPVLVYLFGLDMKCVIGTSSIAVAATMFVTTISFALMSKPISGTAQFGYINILAGVSLGAASLGGSYLGVKSVSKLPVPLIKKIFSVFLIIIVLRILLFE